MLFNWNSKIKNVPPLGWTGRVPSYAAVFVFKNLGEFRQDFTLITIFAVVSYLLRFVAVYLLGQIVTQIQNFSLEQILWYYLPLLAGTMILTEGVDYFIRRYSEALPQVFGEFSTLRFHMLLAHSGSFRLMNMSKEKVLTLVGGYVGHVSAFLKDWIWSITGKAVEFVLVLSVLAYQSKIIFLLNLGYICFFLALSFYVSSRFSPIARNLAEKRSAAIATSTGFIMNLNMIRRLGLQEFFKNTAARFTAQAWQALDRVRRFHANRWFFQLNLFNALYLGTLGYAIYQIKLGLLPLGYLVLLKWAFDRLWQILVYAIEYFVSLVQQKEDALLLEKLLKEVLVLQEKPSPGIAGSPFRKLELRDIHVRFSKEEEQESQALTKEFELFVPAFSVAAGDKIGIIGPSGSGKSTFFDLLLRQVPFTGSYLLNDSAVESESSAALYACVASVNSHDPFFKLSLRENLLLGKEIADETVKNVLNGTQSSSFCPDLNAVVGSSDFNLSTGQMQRLRLARGLINNTEIYLLDEPFSGIDHATRELIMAHLNTELKDKTLILITHNPVELTLVKTVYEFSLNNGGDEAPGKQSMVLRLRQ